jgi:Tfp pilus assembly protein PilV
MKFFLTKNRKQTKGFSLIDLLVAMTITSFLIVGMAQLMCHAIQVKRKTDCSVRAAELASQKIEQLRNTVLSGEAAESSLAEKLEDYRVNHTFLREWSIHEVSMAAKRIKLDCYAINHLRKSTKIILTLSTELGF